MSEVLVAHSLVSEPLVICDHNVNPTGLNGCFRCIDKELLERLLFMASKNNVKVFPAPVIPIDMKKSEKEINEYLGIYNGDEETKLDSEIFFKFLHEKNICFKIFFTSPAFITEYENIKILKTIPSVEAFVGEQAVVEVEEQSNFLQKFTTYYEYEYQTTDGSQQSSFAFMLEFTDNVEIHNLDDKIPTKKIYIVLNKFCNNNLTSEQKLSKKFKDEILHALEILNSHGYIHADAHLGNVVDCGEDSNPQYKLIDFGNMKKTTKDTISDIGIFLSKVYDIEILNYERKFKIIKKYYRELRQRYRFMITNYISEYLHSVCPKAVVSSSYISPEKDDNYHERVAYPSATFVFESKQDFDECKKELPNLKLGERSLIATYSSDEIQTLYKYAENYDTEFRQKIQDIQKNIFDIGEFLSSHTTQETRHGDAYEDSLNTHFTTLRGIFKFEDQGGGQIRYKSKRSKRRKTRTKTKSKSKFKSKSKSKFKSKSKSKSKSKNKHRTRRKSKSKSKSKNKHRTRRKSKSKSKSKNKHITRRK